MNEPCYYRVSVKALITNEAGKFLMAREGDGTWDMLGGGLDYNEDPMHVLNVGSAPSYRDAEVAPAVVIAADSTCAGGLNRKGHDECDHQGSQHSYDASTY